MTEQQTILPPPPSAPPPEPERPRRTVGLRLLIAATVGAFVIGVLVGGGFGALIGYVAHPDAPERGGPFQQRDLPQRPGFGADAQPPSTS